MVGHVSQFQLSRSYGRDRLPESTHFDSVTISCAAGSGHWLFFRCFSLFEMQNNPSQPKNEKSTARKTRPTLVEKMAMLEEIYAGVRRCIFVFAAVSWSINQSIDYSINRSIIQSINRSTKRTIIGWKTLRDFPLEILSTVFINQKQMFWYYVLWSDSFIIYLWRIKERK